MKHNPQLAWKIQSFGLSFIWIDFIWLYNWIFNPMLIMSPFVNFSWYYLLECDMNYFRKITSDITIKTRSLKWTIAMFLIVMALIAYLNKIALN